MRKILKWQELAGWGVARGGTLQVKLKVNGQANVGYNAAWRNDPNNRGIAPCAVAPASGNLDKDGLAVFTITCNPNATVGDGGYLDVTVAGTKRSFHVTVR